MGLFAAGAIGLVFCLSLWYTGSLYWAVGFHAAWDWGESYFYGTSDSGMVAQGHLLGEHPVGKLLWSGGPTGPEGSLLVIPLILIIALAMWLWWGRRVVSPFAGERMAAGVEPEAGGHRSTGERSSAERSGEFIAQRVRIRAQGQVGTLRGSLRPFAVLRMGAPRVRLQKAKAGPPTALAAASFAQDDIV